MIKIKNVYELNKRTYNKRKCLFGRVNNILELPDGNTLAVEFETFDKYGCCHGKMYILSSGYASESRLMYGFLENTAWYQIEAKDTASIDEMREKLIGETVGLDVKYTESSPEILDVFCVTCLQDEGFWLEEFDLVPRQKEGKKHRKSKRPLRWYKENLNLSLDEEELL